MPDTMITMADTPNSSLRDLRERCKAAFRASQEMNEAADEEAFRVSALHPPCPKGAMVEYERGGKSVQRPATAEELVQLREQGDIAQEDLDDRLRQLREWQAACDAVDAQHPEVGRLRKAEKEADELWLGLDKQFVKAPVQTLDDVIVKLEFLTVMEDMHDDPSGESPTQIVFGLIRDLKRMTGAKR